MQYDTIVSITPSGEAPYQSSYGMLHSFMVTFASGVSGRVNAKSPAGPPYKPGQAVWFNVEGQTPQGVNRIKVDAMTPPPQAPAVPQPPPAVPAQPAQPRQPLPRMLPQGATVGMAINNAVQIIIANSKVSKEGLVNLPTLARDVKAIAESILEASHALETRTELEEDPF